MEIERIDEFVNLSQGHFWTKKNRLKFRYREQEEQSLLPMLVEWSVVQYDSRLQVIREWEAVQYCW